MLAKNAPCPCGSGKKFKGCCLAKRAEASARPSSPDDGKDAGRHLWIRLAVPLGIVLTTLVTFLPALHNGFVDWDDSKFFLANPHYRGLGWPQLQWMFTTFHASNYQPLSWVTCGLDYLVWGMNPFGYHLTNLLLHCTNSLVFYFFGVRLLRFAVPAVSGRREVALRVCAGFSALLFSVHPLRVESVAWASERRDVLSGLFFLLTLLAYLKAGEEPLHSSRRTKELTKAMLLYVLSLMSKAIGMTLPIILLILDVYPLRRLRWGSWFEPEYRRVWLEKVPFFLLAFGAGCIALFAQHQGGALAALETHGLVTRFVQATSAIMVYVEKTLVPVRLSPFYPFPRALDWRFLFGGLAALGVSVLLVIFRRRWPALLATWTYYVVVLLPVLGIFQVGGQFVADRYTYLSCMGWALWIGGGVLSRGWLGRSNRKATVLCFGLMLAVVAGLSATTRQQIGIWHDTESLWQHAARIDPANYLAHNNLGVIRFQEGQMDDAVSHFRKAQEANPDYAEAYVNWGAVLYRQGRFDEAIQKYTEALRIKPDEAKARNNLGSALSEQGRQEEAAQQFQQALRIDPNNVEAYNNLGLALYRQGNLEAATDNYRKALKINPSYREASKNLNIALNQAGKFAEAIRTYQESVQANPADDRMFVDWGNVLYKQGKMDQAVENYRRALQINPNAPETYQFLGTALYSQNRIDEAIKQYQHALQINPRYAEAYANLGAAWYTRGDMVKAIECFRQAVNIKQDYAEANNNWGSALLVQGRRQEAIEKYQEALRIKPDYPEARRNLLSATGRSR